MQAQYELTSPKIVRRLWGRWTQIVELYARRRAGRGRIDPRDYRALHQELLAACRTLASDKKNGQASFYEDLRYLAQPWLTPWVFQHTDREILLDLLERCQAAYKKLGGRRFDQLKQLLLRFGLISTLAATVALLVWQVQPRWLPLSDWFDDQWRSLVLGAKGLPGWEWLLVLGVLGIVAGMFAVSRTGAKR
jgi:hypothetical protein